MQIHKNELYMIVAVPIRKIDLRGCVLAGRLDLHLVLLAMKSTRRNFLTCSLAEEVLVLVPTLVVVQVWITFMG